jgi:uncharacterized protein (TIGR00730 family)
MTDHGQPDLAADAERGRTEAKQTVAVYCSSSASVHEDYRRLATELGFALGESGRGLVYGGGKLGLMGAVASACREAGGQTVGVITERLKDAEQLDEANDEVFIVPTMRERKRMMEERADAFVILPGGLGTLEEFFEILVGRLLGEHTKPIALVNCADPVDRSPYYQPLLEMFDHMAHNKFMHRGVLDLIDVCEDVPGVMALLDRWRDAGTGGLRDPDALLPGRLT